MAEATPRSHRCGAFCPSSRANGATPTPSPARSAADKPGARRPTGHAAAADSPQPASRVGNCTLREAGKGKSHWHHAEGGRAREGSGQLKKALKPGTFGEGRDTQQAEGRRGQCSWAAAALQGRRWRAASGGRRGGGASMRGGVPWWGGGRLPRNGENGRGILKAGGDCHSWVQANPAQLGNTWLFGSQPPGRQGWSVLGSTHNLKWQFLVPGSAICTKLFNDTPTPLAQPTPACPSKCSRNGGGGALDIGL